MILHKDIGCSLSHAIRYAARITDAEVKIIISTPVLGETLIISITENLTDLVIF